MDVNELLNRYAQGKRDFSWADFTKADLAGAKLIGISLSRANLTGAFLAKVDLSQANLIKANLSGANLRDANLTGSKLYKTNLNGTQLDGANLTGADLTGVDLDKAILSGAIMPDGKLYEQWLFVQHSEKMQLIPESSVSVDDQPLATPEIIANEALATVARLSEIGAPDRITPFNRKLTARELFNKQILYPFVPLLLGYFLFGQLLAVHDAPLMAWIVAWMGSLIWLIDESLTWFVPLTGAIAVMGSVSMSIVSIVVAGTITLMMIAGMMVLDFGIRKAIKDGLWLGGLAAAFLLMADWFFDGSNAFGGGGIVFRDTFSRALILLFAIVAVAIGSMSWKTMELVGFTQKQTIQIFAGITGLGLLCGWVFVTST